MRNKLEHILLSLLLGTTVLLGLSFWLNLNFDFNLFYKGHWEALAKLQAEQAPVNPNFYISILVAISIFVIGMIVIYIPLIRHKKIQQPENVIVPPAPIIKPSDPKPDPIPEPALPVSRPPRLNLPKNIAQIASKQNEQRIQSVQNTPVKNNYSDEYNAELSQIFSENGYLVKPNPQISGFVPNLFAIGNNEIVWMGGVNCDINALQNAVAKLNSVFHETLEDIKINVYSFIVDTTKKYDANSEILIVPTIDDLRQFISENRAAQIEDSDTDNFNAYSEYIDTIIKYIKNA